MKVSTKQDKDIGPKIKNKTIEFEILCSEYLRCYSYSGALAGLHCTYFHLGPSL